ncbi:MAG: hypothetical protein K6E75_07830 [Lachnospiraceae bacterium]|nr:hypothetical protein [Lachnospiraceae bacterium]
MDLSFENMLYDNSLVKPKNLSAGDAGTKEFYPGLSMLQQEVKDSYPNIEIKGNVFALNEKKYTVRYNSKGAWAFGDVDASVDCIFAISKVNDSTFSMAIVIKECMDIESGSWSLSEEKRKKIMTKDEDINAINEKIIETINKDINTLISEIKQVYEGGQNGE